MRHIDTVLFDWDGTLIDTATQAFNAFVRQLLGFGIALNRETYERIYSPNWYHMYKELGLPREKWQEADDLWLSHYAQEPSHLVSGGDAVIRELVECGYGLGIVTSGTGARVRCEIQALGLTDAFRVVVCGDDVAHGKPHPEGLEMAMRQMGKAPAECCYVGDSPDDIAMGKVAGVLTVAIPGGYPTGKKLLDSKPDYAFESLKQFSEVLMPKNVKIF